MVVAHRGRTRSLGAEDRPRAPRAKDRALVPVAGLAAWLATILVLVSALGPSTVAAVSGTAATFEEVFARSEIVVVATVTAAPPSDATFRMTVEQVLKGPATDELTFPSDPRAVELEPGSRIVLLAVDPASLDFRGTVALVVAADGSIDPDGLDGVPATVADLVATYGTPPTSTARPAAPDGGIPWGVVVAVVAAAACALVAGAFAAARRRAGGR